MTKSTRLSIAYAIGFVISALVVFFPHAALAVDTLSSICSAQNSYAPTNYNGIINPILAPIDKASGFLFDGAGNFAQHLFTLLGTIELVWFIAHTLFFKREIHDLLHGTAFKLVSLMFLMALIVGLSKNEGNFVKTLVFNSFAEIGQTVGNDFGATGYTGIAGSGNTAPTAVGEATSVTNILSEGDCASYAIVTWPAENWNKGLFTGGVSNQNLLQSLQSAANVALSTVEVIASIPGLILAFVVGVLVSLTYLYLAGLMLMAIIDGLITLGVGMLLLGFAGSRWTSAMADNYTKLIFHVGFKVLAINLVAGLGMAMIANGLNVGIAQFESTTINGPSLPFGVLIGLLITAALVAFLAKQVNGIANTLAGSPSINLAGSMVSAGAAAVVVGAAAVTGGVAGAGALMSRSAAGGTMTNGVAGAGLKNTIVDGAAGAAGAAPPMPSLASGTPGASGAAGGNAPAAAPIGAPANGTSIGASAPPRVGTGKSGQPSAPSDSPSDQPPASRPMPEYAANAIDDVEDEEGMEGAVAPRVLAPVASVASAALGRSNESPNAPRTARSNGRSELSRGSGATPDRSSDSGNSGGAGVRPSGTQDLSSRRTSEFSNGSAPTDDTIDDVDEIAMAPNDVAPSISRRATANTNPNGSPQNPRSSPPANNGSSAVTSSGGNGTNSGNADARRSEPTTDIPAAAAAASAASETVMRAAAPASQQSPLPNSDPNDPEDEIEQPLRDRDLTPAAKDARIKRLRSLTDTIKNAVAQHHNHTAVPPGPSIRH